MICFAIGPVSVFYRWWLGHRWLCHRWLADAFDDAENFLFAEDQVVDVLELDVGAGVFAEEDSVADLHVEREDVTFIGDAALADGNHFALLRLFFGAVGDDDAADALFLFFDASDENAIAKGTDVHGNLLVAWRWSRSPGSVRKTSGAGAEAPPGRIPIADPASFVCRLQDPNGLGAANKLALAEASAT